MSKKTDFIKFVDEVIDASKVMDGELQPYQVNALEYLEMLKKSDLEDTKPRFTDNGRIIMQFMQDNRESYSNMFKAKDVADGISVTSRTASGAMRKLVTDGFIEKIGNDPVVYSLTQLGISANLNEEEVDKQKNL